MEIEATLPPKGRDYRLDLLRGFANWAIFLDHIPNNAVNWITQRNYGFSDAADLFVFISGYTASFVYGRIMLDRGFVIGGTRLVKRAWQIYVAHIILFVMYIAEIGYLAQRYDNPNLKNEFNVARFMSNPAETLYQGLILAFKPVNMDVLPLYILLMGVIPRRAVGDAAATEPDAGGVLPALSGGAPLRLEPARLSRWILVFQPVLLAVVVRLRWLVRAGRRTRVDAVDPVAGVACAWRRLSRVRAGHDDGRAIFGTGRHDAGLALRYLQPQRQDEPRALSRCTFHHTRLLYNEISCLATGRASIGRFSSP